MIVLDKIILCIIYLEVPYDAFPTYLTKIARLEQTKKYWRFVQPNVDDEKNMQVL